MSQSPTLDDAISKISSDVTSVLSSAYARQNDLNEFMRLLDDSVKNFEEKGVAIISENLKRLNIVCHTSINFPNFYRSVAKEIGRENIQADYDYYSVTLRIPNTSKLKNLVAPLILGATSEYITEYHKDRTWIFKFVRREGRAMFEHWREQCHTNPVMRITLGLPPRSSLK